MSKTVPVVQLLEPAFALTACPSPVVKPKLVDNYSRENHFKIDGPATINFSGGRTSGLMLRLILDEGPLAPDVFVTFADTGLEREETYQFVRDVEAHWSVPIHWLRRAAPEGMTPFEALIKERQYLPNPITRFCTEELKIRTMQRFMKERGFSDYDSIVGMRADEPRRAHKLIARGQKHKDAPRVFMPLYRAGVTKQDVNAFWAKQPFDLQLQPHEGNCTLCLAGETEVVTSEGNYPIRDLAGKTPNLLIPKISNGGLSGVGSFAPAPVSSFGVQRLWRIQLADQRGATKEVFATAEHRWFLAPRRMFVVTNEVQTQALMAGDELLNLIGEQEDQSTRDWTVVRAEPTDRVEEVFCATVEGVGAFGLADGLMTGNCYLKGRNKKLAIIREHPEMAEWWQRMEQETGATFRAKGLDYTGMITLAQIQKKQGILLNLDEEDDDDLDDCFCTG